METEGAEGFVEVGCMLSTANTAKSVSERPLRTGLKYSELWLFDSRRMGEEMAEWPSLYWGMLSQSHGRLEGKGCLEIHSGTYVASQNR